MRALTLIPLSLVAIGCDSPGTGGRSGRVPVTLTHQTDATSSSDDTTATSNPTSDPTGADDATATTDPTFDPDTAVEPDVTEVTCGQIPLSGTIPGWTLSEGVWKSPAVNLGLGGSGAEQAQIRFADSATGTFDLADEPFGSCDRCVVFTVDSGSRRFQADAGLLVVNDDPSSALDVSIVDAHFVEVSGASPLAGGACYTLGSLHATGAVECVASCTGRECGDDGCGGTCGGGCGPTETCNASGQCVAAGCTSVTLGASVEGVQSQIFQAELPGSSLGTATADYLSLQFYEGDTGTFDLASGDNTNYATCLQCVLVFEDSDGTNVGRFYFQTKGSMTVGSGSDVMGDPPTVSASLSGVELHEVTIDSGTFTSTLVPNGKCVKLQNRSISTP